MQMEFHPYWPIGSPIEEEGFYLSEMDAFKFSTSSLSIQDFSDISSSAPYGSETYSSHFLGSHLPDILPWVNESDVPNNQLDFEGVENYSEWMVSDSSISSSQQIFMEDVSDDQSLSPPTDFQAHLVLPDENMEMDNQISILHLLKAYGDAMGTEQMELAEEIIRRLKEKASPTGKSIERLAFYLTLSLDKQADYLMQESSKNYETAFKAFYQIFPYGRFAHFTANSAILESIPADATVLHIVDFDIGNGVQWPPLIETLGRRGLRMLRLTAMKWEAEDAGCDTRANFEETKKQLCKHATNFGLRLEVEEMDMEGLVKKVKIDSEWLAFNCMVGLPHMEKRSLKHVEEFVTIAKALIRSDTSKGVITFGDGIGIGKWTDHMSFDSLFQAQLVYFQALLESMEQFQFVEARIAMECLFVVPHLCSLANNAQKWKETSREGYCITKLGLEAQRMSLENYLEAKELVSEGEGSYWVNSEGEDANQMVLGYMGVPMVRVSSLR